MQIDILTLFPEMFLGPFEWSIVKRAKEKNLVKINIHDLRNWATDKYRSVDDRPYGGGAGMVMRVDIIDQAVASLREKNPKAKVILMDAGGKRWTQKRAQIRSRGEGIIIICGHYEGVDYRVAQHIADEIISVGPYVLSGGELPAMTVVDSIVRLLPGVLGNADSLKEESFNTRETEYPQFTRPEEYNGWKVPEVLLSGDHKKIQNWRKNAKS